MRAKESGHRQSLLPVWVKAMNEPLRNATGLRVAPSDSDCRIAAGATRGQGAEAYRVGGTVGSGLAGFCLGVDAAAVAVSAAVAALLARAASGAVDLGRARG